jgi:hypothetical protein
MFYTTVGVIIGMLAIAITDPSNHIGVRIVGGVLCFICYLLTMYSEGKEKNK